MYSTSENLGSKNVDSKLDRFGDWSQGGYFLKTEYCTATHIIMGRIQKMKKIDNLEK